MSSYYVRFGGCLDFRGGSIICYVRDVRVVSLRKLVHNLEGKILHQRKLLRSEAFISLWILQFETWGKKCIFRDRENAFPTIHLNGFGNIVCVYVFEKIVERKHFLICENDIIFRYAQHKIL